VVHHIIIVIHNAYDIYTNQFLQAFPLLFTSEIWNNILIRLAIILIKFGSETFQEWCVNGVQKSILNMKTFWLHHVYGFRVVSLCTLKFTNLGLFVKENVIYKNNICINIVCIV
jgi:hypothetical protein